MVMAKHAARRRRDPDWLFICCALAVVGMAAGYLVLLAFVMSVWR